MKKLIITGVCLFSFLSGCGKSEVEIAIESFPVEVIEVVYTVGESMGDSNYVFGTIASALPTPDGGVAVLDLYSCKISFFDHSGNFIRSIGSRGEGPGEFLLPIDFTILDDGRIAVVDLVFRRIDILSETGELLNSLNTGDAILPFKMSAVADSSFLIYYYSTSSVGESFDMGFNLEIWDTSGLQQEVWSWRSEYTGSEFVFSPGYISCCSGNGNIYYSEMASNDFSITCISALDGSSYSIEKEAVSCEADSSDTGYIEPKVYVNYEMENALVDLESEPLCYRPQIASMGVDYQGRLWVRNGTTDEEDWFLFNAEGEYAGSGTITGISEQGRLKYVINKNGAVAWAPFTDEYPRLYVLSAN